MKMSRVWIALGLIGCQQIEDDELAAPESSTESSIISATTPYVGPSVLNPADYPALAARGRLPEAHYAQTGPEEAHAAQFSDGVDLGAVRVTDGLSSPASRTSWIEALRVVPDAKHLQAPAFATHLEEALADANTKMGDLNAGTLELAAKVFDVIPGFESHVDDFPLQRFTTWTPPRARWLDSQWQLTMHPARPYPETHYRYPTPAGLAAIPQRGARLYCAAREMAFQQTAGSLGEQVLLPISILGQNLDIGVVEAFAFIDRPKQFTGDGASDGAQAFNIPLSLGTKISPIRNLLPALPELRYPLVLTTGDSEIVADTDLEWIIGNKCNRFFCVPWPTFRTRYKTVAHADTALSANQAMTAHAEFPVFWVGPLQVLLGLDFNAGIGRPAPRPIRGSTPTPHVETTDQRILELTAPPFGWPTEIRGGNASDPYLDGPWALNTSYVPGDATPRVFSVRSIDGTTSTIAAAIGLPVTTALHSSVLADDDHHVAPTSELVVGGSLIGKIEIPASIAHIKIEASGSVFGTLGLAHDVRDAVVATTTPTPQPISALTIMPIGYGSAEINFLVTFDLHISLGWLGSIDVHYELINETEPIDSFRSPWDEQHRLRIGTESTSGDPTQQPAVYSHHGADAAFLSFPTSVNACLADTRPVPPPPPRCTSELFTTPTLPRVENCLYMPLENDNQCLNIPVVTPESELVLQCAAAKLTYMCSPISKIQDFKSEHVLAHRMNLGSANINDLEEISRIVEICARAEGASIPPTDAGVTAWFKTQFTVAACDASATLIAPGDAITAGKPSAVTAGSCP